MSDLYTSMGNVETNKIEQPQNNTPISLTDDNNTSYQEVETEMMDLSSPQEQLIDTEQYDIYIENLENVKKELEAELQAQNNEITPDEVSLNQQISTYKNNLSALVVKYTQSEDLTKRDLGMSREEFIKLSPEEQESLVATKTEEGKSYKQNIETLESQLEKTNTKNENITQLEGNIALLNTAINSLKQQKEALPYQQMLTTEEYQNYESKSEVSNDISKYATNYDIRTNIDYERYCEENGNISPLELLKGLKEQNPTIPLPQSMTGVENIGELKQLLELEEVNPEMVKLYNYIYDTEGKDAANKYLDIIKPQLNQMQGQKQAQEYLNSLEKDENGNYNQADVLNHLKTSGKGLGDGVENFFQGFANLFNSTGELSVNDYETIYIMQALEENGGLLSNNYELSQSIGNVAPSIIISMLATPMVGTAVGGTIGSVSMGLSSGGNAYAGALSQGYSTPQAIMYGVLTGSTEAITQKLLGGLPGLNDVAITGVKTYLQASAREGFQEGVQSVMDSYFRSILFGEEIDLEQLIDEVGTSAVYGAITAGIFNSPNLTINCTNKAIQKLKGVDGFDLATLENNLGITISELETQTNTSEVEVLENEISPTAKIETNISVSKEKLSKQTLSMNSFLETPVDEQLKILDNISFAKLDIYDSFISEINKSENLDALDSEVVQKINDKMIEEQDIISLRFADNIYYTKYVEYISNTPSILEQLEDKNLVRLLEYCGKGEVNSDNIVQEVRKRVENGSLLFNQSEFQKSIFGLKIKNLEKGFNNLPQDIRQQITQQSEEIITQYLPTELQLNNNISIFQKLSIATLYKENKIDSKGEEIISELQSENMNNLTYFDFNILNPQITSSFDKEFIKTIGKYPDLSYKITALAETNPDLFEIYKQAVQVAKSDDSLNNQYVVNLNMLDFLFENQAALKDMNINNTNIDDLIEYCLYYNVNFLSQPDSKKIRADFNNDFHKEIDNKCDEQFNSSKEKAERLSEEEFSSEFLLNTYLNDMKNVYLQKYFSLTMDEAQSFLNKYGNHLNEISEYLQDEDGQQLETVVNYLEKIVNISDRNELTTLYENQDFRITSEELLALDSIAREKYAKTYEESFQKTQDTIEELLPSAENVEHNGVTIKIIDAPEEFSMLVHSSETGFTTESKELVNDSYIDTWNNIDNPQTHGLATSFISNQNLGTAPVKGTGVIYGFYNLTSQDIYGMGPYDLNSHIANYGFRTGKQQEFISADNISSNTRREYNEFVLSRAESKPSCIIITTDMDQQLLDNAYKAASEWEIPIIKIDKSIVATNQMEQTKEYIKQFEQNKNVEDLQRAIDVFESGKSGFGLNRTNTTETFEGRDNTALEGIYDSSVIDTAIENYMKELSDSNASRAQWQELYDVLQQEQQKYTINDIVNSVIPKTTSSIDLTQYLEDIKKEIDKAPSVEFDKLEVLGDD